ncbi:formate dehydrogenase subunit gamma [Actimicrobium sp. CCI2.3]|uniref:formate dehydrogenase subunit gamma n=1 Tax=Actimicrobium sp. CCI2.3 TaxID=3048616 RepID=UPI002AB39743|nr:formate dehydrogenase subunit gamma [Actimicrobium sp. CCI2.3]MDY7574853.1 formate dehydrogenase subunit gamma [Actimicrobium sp. CCI2.3]MEB0020186.1 formate dehydrogenase subunit gamma [Actimicrobium sp. CCI2.3]
MVKYIHRYATSDRVNHWIVAMCFIVLSLSGLAFFHPSYFFLSSVLGGPVWARILHPFIGIVLSLTFVGLSLRVWKDNRFKAVDIEWLKRIDEVINNGDGPDKLPIGKYNAGQKLMFWSMVWSIGFLLVSGIVIWRAWFAGYFPIVVVRWGVVIHMLAAFVGIVSLIVHVYAAIWVKGTLRAMTRGNVDAAWAKHHHPEWYREMTQEKVTDAPH